MREYLKDTILEHPLITIVVSGVVLYALFSYGVIYYENKNDEFIEEHHSRIWNRHSFFSELNFLEHNLFIKEKICNYFDSKSSIPFPSGCWKDKKKFLELKNELYKVYDLQRISYNSQRIAEVENILEKQSTIDLDKSVFYMRNKEDYVEIGSNHRGKYKEHGEWVKPVFPSNISLAGSPMTPYIFDDRAQYEDAGEALLEWYKAGEKERERCRERCSERICGRKTSGIIRTVLACSIRIIVSTGIVISIIIINE